MRRTHKWVAAIGGGMLAGSLLMAPTASALPAPQTPPAQAATAQVASPAQATTGVLARPKYKRAKYRYGKPNRADKCDYPANNTPSVRATAPSKARKGQTIKIEAKVSRNKCKCDGFEAALYVSIGGGWEQVDTSTVRRDGKVSFRYKITETSLFKVVVAPRHGAAPGVSNKVAVEVKHKKAKKKRSYWSHGRR